MVRSVLPSRSNRSRKQAKQGMYTLVSNSLLLLTIDLSACMMRRQRLASVWLSKYLACCINLNDRLIVIRWSRIRRKARAMTSLERENSSRCIWSEWLLFSSRNVWRQESAIFESVSNRENAKQLARVYLRLRFPMKNLLMLHGTSIIGEKIEDVKTQLFFVMFHQQSRSMIYQPKQRSGQETERMCQITWLLFEEEIRLAVLVESEYVLVNECSMGEFRSTVVVLRKQCVRCTNHIDENTDFGLNQWIQSNAHLGQVILASKTCNPSHKICHSYHKTIDHTFMFHVLLMIVPLSCSVRVVYAEHSIWCDTATGSPRSIGHLRCRAVVRT